MLPCYPGFWASGDNDNISIKNLSIESDFEILWLQKKRHWQLFMKLTLMLQSQIPVTILLREQISLTLRWKRRALLRPITRVDFPKLIFSIAIAAAVLICWFFVIDLFKCYRNDMFLPAFKEFSRKGTSKNLFEKCTQSYKSSYKSGEMGIRTFHSSYSLFLTMIVSIILCIKFYRHVYFLVDCHSKIGYPKLPLAGHIFVVSLCAE